MLYLLSLGLNERQQDQRVDWFTSIYARNEHIAAAALDAIRTSLLSRRVTGGMLLDVLNVWADIAAHPITQKYTQPMLDRPDCPVRWIMKALQRQLCVCVGDEWECDIVAISMEGML